MKIQHATVHDIYAMRQLIQYRIDWMNQNGIQQWNTFDYLDIFNEDYFKKNIEYFYLLMENNSVIGFYALYNQDPYWEDDMNYYSIHHLTSHPDHKGVGKILMNSIIQKAKQDKKDALRLDYLYGNINLETYYKNYGFQIIDDFYDHDYHGVRMQKIL